MRIKNNQKINFKNYLSSGKRKTITLCFFVPEKIVNIIEANHYDIANYNLGNVGSKKLIDILKKIYLFSN